MQRTTTCSHLPAEVSDPRAETCEACGEVRNLRACVTCGHVGCCESLNAHNTAHYQASGHAVIRSMPIEAGFTWCYSCEAYL